MFILGFWDLEILTKNFDEELSFAPISLKLVSAYVSEDSMKMKA